MIVYNNTSDIRDSISPVCMREISVDEAVTIDKDVQLLRVMDGHNDADITLHIAQGVRCVLSCILIGQPAVTNRLSLDVVLAAGAYADVHILGCARDASTLSVDARVLISEGATDAEGYLQTRTMLLGDDACVRMVPGLDVHHDQVAAGHGARIDTIDAGLLYYMMSRGLDHHQAQSLIVSGAVREHVEYIDGEYDEIVSQVLELLDIGVLSSIPAAHD